MSLTRLAAGCAALALALPAVAGAQTTSYALDYTTFDDGQNPPVSLMATLTAVPSQIAGAYTVTGLVGTRNGLDIVNFDPFSSFYFPAKVPTGYQFSTFFDAGQVTLDFFTSDGTEYLLSRGPSDSTFYHEFEDPFGLSTGRLIQPASLALTRVDATPAVSEPASWAMMVAGFAAVGYTLRHRRAAVALPASA